MKAVCAWCNKDLGTQGDKPGITHGICDPCKAKLHKDDVVPDRSPAKREKAPHQHYVVVHVPGGKSFRWYTSQKSKESGVLNTKLSGGEAIYLARKISLNKRFAGYEVRAVRMELETQNRKAITFLNGNIISKD